MNGDQRRLSLAITVTKSAANRMACSLSEDLELLSRVEIDREATDVLRAADAFIQRYQQLVEHMTHRLFPAIYRCLSVGDRAPPLRALLTMMEEEGATCEAKRWAQRMELRNQLVHEYPIDPADRTSTFGAAVNEASAMLEEFEVALSYISARTLLGNGDEKEEVT